MSLIGHCYQTAGNHKATHPITVDLLAAYPHTCMSTYRFNCIIACPTSDPTIGVLGVAVDELGLGDGVSGVEGWAGVGFGCFSFGILARRGSAGCS